MTTIYFGENCNLTVLNEGNRDERCYIQGHDWEKAAYFWDFANGTWQLCRRCGREIVKDADDSRLPVYK